MADKKTQTPLEYAAERLCSYALTCEQKDNNAEWMFGLVDKINRVCEALGDEDRFYFDETGSCIVQHSSTIPEFDFIAE